MGLGVSDILHHDMKHSSADECLDFCAAEYQWDLKHVVRSLQLDLYSCIRLANFLRKEVAQQRAADKALTDEELLRKLQLPFANSARPTFLNDDALLYPFLEDDELLSALCQESLVDRAEVETHGRHAVENTQRPPLQDAEGALLWEAGVSGYRGERPCRAGGGSEVEEVVFEMISSNWPGAAARDVGDDSDVSSAGSSLCVSPRLLAAHMKGKHAAAVDDVDGAGGGKRKDAETEREGMQRAGRLGTAETGGDLEARARLQLGASSGPPPSPAAQATPSVALPDLPALARKNTPLIAFPDTLASSSICEPLGMDSDSSRRSLFNPIITPATPCTQPTPRRPVPSPPNPTPVSLLPGLFPLVVT